MKKKFILLTILSFYILDISAQNTQYKQELGINMAGLVLKNEETVAPSLFYKYKNRNYQLRVQLSYDLRYNDKDRNYLFFIGTNLSNSSIDSALKFEPGKNLRYGFQIGFQKNISIQNSDFSYFYGLDMLFFKREYQQKGEGTIITGGSAKVESSIKVSNTQKLTNLGIGVPLGINYYFGKRCFINLEGKIIMTVQDGEDTNFTEVIRPQGANIITSTFNHSTKNKGFNIGIIPLSGFTIGVQF